MTSFIDILRADKTRTGLISAIRTALLSDVPEGRFRIVDPLVEEALQRPGAGEDQALTLLIRDLAHGRSIEIQAEAFRDELDGLGKVDDGAISDPNSRMDEPDLLSKGNALLERIEHGRTLAKWRNLEALSNIRDRFDLLLAGEFFPGDGRHSVRHRGDSLWFAPGVDVFGEALDSELGVDSPLACIRSHLGAIFHAPSVNPCVLQQGYYRDLIEKIFQKIASPHEELTTSFGKALAFLCGDQVGADEYFPSIMRYPIWADTLLQCSSEPITNALHLSIAIAMLGISPQKATARLLDESGASELSVCKWPAYRDTVASALGASGSYRLRLNCSYYAPIALEAGALDVNAQTYIAANVPKGLISGSYITWETLAWIFPDYSWDDRCEESEIGAVAEVLLTHADEFGLQNGHLSISASTSAVVFLATKIYGDFLSWIVTRPSFLGWVYLCSEPADQHKDMLGDPEKFKHWLSDACRGLDELGLMTLSSAILAYHLALEVANNGNIKRIPALNAAVCGRRHGIGWNYISSVLSLLLADDKVLNDQYSRLWAAQFVQSPKQRVIGLAAFSPAAARNSSTDEFISRFLRDAGQFDKLTRDSQASLLAAQGRWAREAPLAGTAELDFGTMFLEHMKFIEIELAKRLHPLPQEATDELRNWLANRSLRLDTPPNLFTLLTLLEKFNQLPQRVQKAISERVSNPEDLSALCRQVESFRKLRNKGAHGYSVRMDDVVRVRGALLRDGILSRFIDAL